MSTKNTNNIISQTSAARIAGTSRQAISSLRINSTYNFFTENGKVDINNPDWHSYLEERKNKGSLGKHSAEKITINKATRDSGTKKRIKKEVDQSKKKQLAKNEWNRKHSLTGGFDPGMFVPTNPAQLKSLTDIAAKSLEMRIKLGEYIHRDIIENYMDKISNEINQFVYLGRSISKKVCEKLDRIGMEKTFEKIIAEEVEKIIIQIIKSCNDIKKI
jgi:hypothetical protein